MPPAREDLLVLVTPGEDGLGDTAKGMLTLGRRAAARLGLAWAAAVLADGEDPELPEAALETLADHGVPGVLVIRAGRPLGDFPEARAEALAGAARARAARLVLMAHDSAGASLAPRVAAALGGAVLTECVSVEPGDGGVRVSRRALGDRLAETFLWDRASPLVLTVHPGCLSPVPPAGPPGGRPVVEAVEVPVPDGAFRSRVVERIPPDPRTVDVSEAEVVFCAGKGFDRESFERFRELAGLLNASLGVTRPVYDLGWAGFERMIGQTGKTVAPRLYLGVGISGSMHHVGGIRDARRIVCLNIDPRAPMFAASDEGFVGDLREVIPLLLDRVRARTAGGGAP